MDTWTLIRFLHLLALALFVGGQLMLVAVIVPAMRGRPDDGTTRAVGRRFGMASGVALLVLLVTGIAMAGHFDRWGDGTLHAKLGLLVAVFVLTGLHATRPHSRALSIAVFALSLAIVYLGVELAHGF